MIGFAAKIRIFAISTKHSWLMVLLRVQEKVASRPLKKHS